MFGIADGSRPGRAERAEGQPGRVAAMPKPCQRREWQTCR